MYRDQGNLEKAQKYLERSVSIKEKVFDSDHFIVGEALNDLGVVYIYTPWRGAEGPDGPTKSANNIQLDLGRETYFCCNNVEQSRRLLLCPRRTPKSNSLAQEGPGNSP